MKRLIKLAVNQSMHGCNRKPQITNNKVLRQNHPFNVCRRHLDLHLTVNSYFSILFNIQSASHCQTSLTHYRLQSGSKFVQIITSSIDSRYILLYLLYPHDYIPIAIYHIVTENRIWDLQRRLTWVGSITLLGSAIRCWLPQP